MIGACKRAWRCHCAVLALSWALSLSCELALSWTASYGHQNKAVAFGNDHDRPLHPNGNLFPLGNRIDNLAPITLSLRLHKRAALYRGIRVGTRIAAGTGVHVECAKRREGKG